jgi:hypothetical protein
MMTPPDKLGYTTLLALGQDFHRAVPSVPNPSGDPKLVSLLTGGRSEKNTLNIALHNEVFSNGSHGYACRKSAMKLAHMASQINSTEGQNPVPRNDQRHKILEKVAKRPI